MFQKILLYVIAGLALLCMGLGITVAVEEVRIARFKAELNTAILERDSLKALSTSQTENLANLNILLGEQDKACRKRLDARKAVDATFNKTERSPTCAGEETSLQQGWLGRGSGCEAPSPISKAGRTLNSSGVPAPSLNFRPADKSQGTQVNYEVISFDESISSIGIINDNLRMFRSEGDISGISPRVLSSDPSGASPAK